MQSKNSGRKLIASCLGCVLAAVTPAAAESVANDAVPSVGLTNSGPGLFFIVVAVVVLMALMLRSQPPQLGSTYRKWRAERKIRRVLRNCGNDVIHDFVLPGAFGGMTPIDSALLTKGGIICILTKHYDGTIFGTPDDPQWLNIDGTVRRNFLNPMIQNASRVRALQQIVPGVPVRNLVVFTGNVHFAADRDKNVIQLEQLPSYVAMFRFGPSQVEDWDASWLSIKSAALDNSQHRNGFLARPGFL